MKMHSERPQSVAYPICRVALAVWVSGLALLLSSCADSKRGREEKGSARDVKLAEKESRNEPRGGEFAEGDRTGRSKGDEKREPAKKDALSSPAGGGMGGTGVDGKPTPPKAKNDAPKVWKRDAARPSVARVYVGDRNTLELVSMHVSVHVEGPRARTLVDHVFRNPHDRQLEGTFEYPLPAGASPSYYAMFLGATASPNAPPPQRFKGGSGGNPLPLPESLAPSQLARSVDAADWGRLQEARLIAPEKAREAYEEVVRGRVDPALLEYASGNTFRGRVFPIAPRGYNRVLVAYEETLPVSAGQLVYRFALPNTKVPEIRVSLEASAREFTASRFAPKEARQEKSDSRLAYSHTWTDAAPGGEVLFTGTPVDEAVQVTSGKHTDKGPLFTYARLRPSLPAVPKEEPFARHAVFLLDTSLSEHADRFGVSMRLLGSILENDSGIEKFNIIAFNAGAVYVAPEGWLPNTKEGREKALSRLDGVVLEGATDLSAALEKLIKPDFAVEAKTPIGCFVLSDGHLTWGQTEVAPLVAGFRQRCANPVRFFCYRTGLGQENADLYDALTRDGGGVFQCYSDAEVSSASKAHRRQCLSVEKLSFSGEGAGEAKEVLVAGRRSAVYPEGELIVAAQFAKSGKRKVVLEGTFAGKKFTQSFALDAGASGELAGRGWGEVAVASLASLGDPWVEDLATAYCQEFGIASRFASFLVLENEAEYKRLGVDDEKGKTVGSDLGKFLDDAWKALAKESSARQAMGKLLALIDPKTQVLSGSAGAEVKRLLGMLSESDCVLPQGTVKGAILLGKNADKTYLDSREKDRRAVNPYLEESQRRANEEDMDGAVRVLSSVIEEHTGRGDALRLVGYRLLDLRRPELAARLFATVLKGRPYEPHSFRDLGRSLEESGRYGLAALCYEAVLAGTWHARFGDALKVVTREDYGRVLAGGLKSGGLSKEQEGFFRDRLAKLGGERNTADLRVSITWNTDATDVDLHVVEPDQTRVLYSNPRSKSGGQLSQDQTQGYGPERYQTAKAMKGEYQIFAHYFAANPNLLGGETHVSVTITRFAGTEREQVERRTVILRRAGEMVPVTRLKF